MPATVKKTYTVTHTELELLEKIKDKALSEKVIISDSQIIRLGIYLVANLSKDKLIKANSGLPLPFKKPSC